MFPEYRWLLFDIHTREAKFAADYDIVRDADHTICFGLFCFPKGTIYPRFQFFGRTFGPAVGAARRWLETVARPMREAMPYDEWHELVRQTAYFQWIDEGCPEGREDAHWIAASSALADLLNKEYVYVRFEDPEEVDLGPYEENTNAVIAEPEPVLVLEGGQEHGVGDAPAAGVSGSGSRDASGIIAHWIGRKAAKKAGQ